MTSRISKICLALIVVLIMFSSACQAVSGLSGTKSTLISSLGADYMAVYPNGMSEIKCVTSVPAGDTVQFTWSSDGGSVTGNGATVIWQAPNEYGDYHVMVTAKDSNGGKAEAVLTLSVVPRPQRACCGSRR